MRKQMIEALKAHAQAHINKPVVICSLLFNLCEC
jgi:hypothetical protein